MSGKNNGGKLDWKKQALEYARILGIITAVAALFLSLANVLTLSARQRQERLSFREKVYELLGDRAGRCKLIVKDDKVLGALAYSSDPEKPEYIITLGEARGYGGFVKVAVAMDVEYADGHMKPGKIEGVAVVDASKETPGLGSRIKEKSFLERFKGKTYKQLHVGRNGVEAITGATISSTAAIKAARKAYRRATEILGNFESYSVFMEDCGK